MKVLYIDGVGPFGGASRSLYEAVRALPHDEVEAYFVAAKGTAASYYAGIASGIVVALGLTRFDNTRYSHYRGLRWIVLLRELCHVPSTLLAIVRARLRWKNIDLIHVNEVTEVFPMLVARWLFKVPVVMHVRSLAWNYSKSVRCRWISEVLRHKVAAVVAIDESVRASLPEDLPVEVIHNAFTPKYAAEPDEAFSAKIGRLHAASFKVGFVGNLQLAKGLFDLLEAAKIVSEGGHKVEFLIVGDTTRKDKGLRDWLLNRLGLQQDIKAELVNKIQQYGLTNSFHLLGATYDIQRAYEQFDVLCFPSHFDAPGRPIFEAAFASVPSIAAIDAPKADTLIPDHTGLTVPAHDPVALAKAILYLVHNPTETKRMGENARILAEENFHAATNAHKLFTVYQRVLNHKV